MKKASAILSLIVVFGFIFMPDQLFAASDHTSTLKKIKTTVSRGLVNVLTLPAELVSTFKREKTNHPKAYPVSFIPRSLCNIVIRIASAANDIFISPIVAPFVDETPHPITEAMELPVYPWQTEIV